MLDGLELDGWDRDDQGRHLTFIHDSRLAKITVQEVSFADRGDGWLAKLWLKRTPHGRSRFQRDVAAADRDALTAKIADLAAEALD